MRFWWGVRWAGAWGVHRRSRVGTLVYPTSIVDIPIARVARIAEPGIRVAMPRRNVLVSYVFVGSVLSGRDVWL